MRRQAGAVPGALLCILALAGCTAAEHHYAGSPGSVYDRERDPPFVIGKAGYDPLAPITARDYGNGGSPASPAAPANR